MSVSGGNVFCCHFFKACGDWDLRSPCYRDSTVHLSSTTTPLLRHLYTVQEIICYNSLSQRPHLSTVLLNHPQTSQQHIKTCPKSNLFYPTSSKLCPSSAATASSKIAWHWVLLVLQTEGQSNKHPVTARINIYFDCLVLSKCSSLQFKVQSKVQFQI